MCHDLAYHEGSFVPKSWAMNLNIDLNHASVTVFDDGIYLTDSSRGYQCLMYYPDNDTSDYRVAEGTVALMNDVFAYKKLHSVILPDSLISIGAKAFQGCRYMKEIDLGNGVKEIGNAAFCDCSSLEHITLPDSLKKIGNKAFAGCVSMKEFHIPASVQMLGGGLFAGSGIEKVTIDGSRFKVEGNAIYSLDGKTIYSLIAPVKEFTIPDKVEHIGNLAFAGCDDLETVNIPCSVKTIGASAFSECYKLIKVNLPPKLKAIKEATFWFCQELESLALPQNLETIGDTAFGDCFKLTNMTIPDKVKSIGHDAFNDCYSMEEINLPKSLKRIDGNPFAESGIRRIRCESDAFKVEDGILYSADGTKLIFCFGRKSSLTVSSSVKEIGPFAFQEADSLNEITIPASVLRIGDFAFVGCPRLEEMHILGNPALGHLFLDDCPSLKKLHLRPYMRNKFLRNCSFYADIDTPIIEAIVSDEKQDT